MATSKDIIDELRKQFRGILASSFVYLHNVYSIRWDTQPVTDSDWLNTSCSVYAGPALLASGANLAAALDAFLAVPTAGKGAL